MATRNFQPVVKPTEITKRLARVGRPLMWIDLTQPFHADVPHSASLPAPTVETLSDVESDGVNAQWFCSPTHVGTHVDAPRHFVADGRTIDELPLDQFTGRATVIDVQRSEPERIPLSEIEASADTAALEAADIVGFYTGWDDRYDDPSYHHYPWFDAAVADWLLDYDVKLVCSDTPSPDRPREMRPDDWDAYPIHRRLLGADVLIAEHLRNLDELIGRDARVYGFPLKLRDGDGAPARFVAHVD